MHHPRGAERAVAEPEIQGRSDDHDQVGLGERRTARAGREQRVPDGHDAAPHAVGHDREPGGLGQPAGRHLRAAGPHVATQHEHRSLRVGQQLRYLLDVVRVRIDRERTCTARRHGVGVAVEDVHRQVQEHRAAVRRGRQRECRVDPLPDLVGRPHRAGRLGDRRQQRRLVELLQRARTPAVLRCATAEDHDRAAVVVGRRDSRDPVRHTGPGGQHGQARPAGQLGQALGSEHRGLLVPHVHQPHRCASPSSGRAVLAPDRGVVQREDMCS